MKRTLSLVLMAVMCIGLLAGCGGSTESAAPESTAPESTAPESTAPESTAPEALSGIVNTNGSTSMNDVILALTEGFGEVQPDVTVNYTGSGSGAGIEGVLAGSCDLGLSSRALTDEEKAEGAVENIIALDGVAVVINPENTVTDLTIEQIAQIFTGEITNWSELGGSDGQVVPIGREAGSGTRDGFESITGTEDACKYQNELTSTGEVIASVASNPNAIGYASLSAVDETVKALTVGGVAPSEATVLDGTYAIQRNFNFIVSDSTELSEAAQAFVDWATSTEASDLIAGAGAVPVA